MISIVEFEQNLSTLMARMDAACLASGRSSSTVQLLPVTKNHPVDAVKYASISGLNAVGENRVQEAAGKRAETELDIFWELIGHLQSNKAKEAVAIFDRIQSVDSIKLINRLDRFAEESGKRLSILLQCNTGEDPKKFGFRVEQMEAALEAALAKKHLEVQGFMTVAPLNEDANSGKRAFERLRAVRDSLEEKFGVALPELSMGMTEDLEEAIAAGSTQIRVGTALYGARQYGSET